MDLRRGCLKRASNNFPFPPSPNPGASASGNAERPRMRRKNVSFCCEEELVEVYEADDVDRTPHEPVRNMSYQETLELKAMQRSLPYADQPPDPHTGKPGSRILKNVPVTLLPFFDGDTPTSPPPQSPPTSPPTTSSASSSGTSTSTAAGLGSPPGRRKPNFSFLPLFDETSTSPTTPSPTPTQSSFMLSSAPTAAPEASTHSIMPPVQKKKKKRVFEINGIEMEMSEDEEDEEAAPSTAKPLPESSSSSSNFRRPRRRKKSVIMVNDMEIELSESESESEPETDGAGDNDDDDALTVASSSASSSQYSSPPRTPPQEFVYDGDGVEGRAEEMGRSVERLKIALGRDDHDDEDGCLRTPTPRGPRIVLPD